MSECALSEIFNKNTANRVVSAMYQNLQSSSRVSNASYSKACLDYTSCLVYKTCTVSNQDAVYYSTSMVFMTGTCSSTRCVVLVHSVLMHVACCMYCRYE